MSALDGVLADLVEADRECAYVTVKREPLETLIDEWARRGDQISLLFRLLAPAQHALAQEVLEESVAAVARHRHAVRREFAARLPESPAAQYAVASALAHRASDTNFDRICLYLDRMPTEFRVLSVRDATLRDQKIKYTAGYTKWAIQNHHVLA